MATQIFAKTHAVMLPRPADAEQEPAPEAAEPRGNIFRGFLFAMIFNVFLVLAGLAAWELWRLIVR